MFTLPELPYAFDALQPFIDKETMEIHHDRHHATYIKNLNDALSTIEGYTVPPLETLLQSLNTVPEMIRTKVRNNAGGHYNHSLFWTIMSKATGQEVEGVLKDAIFKTFGDIKTLQQKIIDAGLSRFGSGWVWLVVENNELKVMDTPNQDSPIMDGKKPIFCIDVWEHAYYLKYQNKRADYLTAFWNVVNWREVEKLYENAMT
mgnify:CR=1 FL=1